MSEIITDKLTGRATAGDVTITSEGGAVTMQLQQGVAKIWVNIDQTTNVIENSFNTASFTDNGTGNMTVTYTNSLSSGDKAYFGNDQQYGIGEIFGNSTYSHLHRTRGTSSSHTTLVDTAYSNSGAMGDLA
jgi:hypothetical protein